MEKKRRESFGSILDKETSVAVGFQSGEYGCRFRAILIPRKGDGQTQYDRILSRNNERMLNQL